MKVYLVHHTDALSREQDPERHLSELGREQADRIAHRLKDSGAAPVRIVHSDRQWTTETGQRIAAILGTPAKTETVDYPCNTGDSVEPFIDDIRKCPGDIMMTGHHEYLVRTASRLLCGDEEIPIVVFKPGNGAMFCLEGEGNDWEITFGWRPEHAPG